MALPVDIDSISLTQQLSSPPKASLQILGTHSVNQDNNFIDFDIWVDCTKISGIESAKFLTDREAEPRSWSYSADHDNDDPKVILAGWLDDWLNHISTDDRRSVRLMTWLQLSCLILTEHVGFQLDSLQIRSFHR